MNTLNFQSWINLFALTVELFSGFPANEHFSVKTYLDDLSKIHFSSNKENKVLYIDFYCEKTGERLISYVLVPWQDLYPVYKQNDIPINITENVRLTAVNPFCILFETNAHPAPGENQVIFLEKITNMTEDLFDIKNANTPVNERDSYTQSNGIQVIEIESYPFYTDIQVAIPGSGHIHPDSIKKRFPNKMIRLTQIPETGKVRTSWLVSGQAITDTLILNNQQDIISFFNTAITKCKNDINDTSRKKVSEETMALIEKRLSENHMAVHDFLTQLLNKLTLIEHSAYGSSIYNNPFPDYQPKTTPDDVIDYRPSIADEIAGLPEPEPDNLVALLNLYLEYRTEVVNNPGEWTEGNILLGAKEKEYHPSNAELLLSETSKRIKTIIDKYNKKDVKQILRKNNIKVKEIEYTEFLFIHYDVMGSGRFFYIDDMEDISFKLY